MIALLALQGIVAMICLAPGRRSERWAIPVATFGMFIGFIWILTQASAVTSGEITTENWNWVPQLGLTLDFRLDGWALLMGLLIFGIGTLVLGYSHFYFPKRPDLGKIAGLLAAFAGAMWGLVAANGLFTLFLFWELTSVISFLLIGLEDRSSAARKAATRAFLVTGGGGIAMLAGLILLSSASGTSEISEILANPPTNGVVPAALVLVLIGAFAKSAQFPLHFWLPGAMAAPTPISAYLHSATMVKAGLVVVARFAPVFAEVPPWRFMVLTAGSISLLLGGMRALRQHDAKLILAHGTVSQLGLLMILLGVGTAGTTYAGVALLTAHALFKASLFLNIGVVDHQVGTRDIRRLRGLLRKLPVIAAATVTAGASMAAIPPTFGFVAKEKGLDALLKLDMGFAGTITVAAVVVGSAFTVAYTVRLLMGVFGNRAPGTAGHPPVNPARVKIPSWGFKFAPVLLAFLSLLFGLIAGPVGDWLGKVASSLDPASNAYHLVLWPGLNSALALSVVTWVGGSAIAWWLYRHERDADAGVGFATTLYDRSYNGLLLGARKITAVTHSGSLPVYVGVALATLIACFVAALAAGDLRDLGTTRITNSPIELGAVAVTAVLTVGILRTQRRFSAALLLGGAGYGLAIVFLSYGAPDLAFTQFLVETLVIVLYLLVLARLPEKFSRPPSWAPGVVRGLFAAAVGIGLALFAVATSAVRSDYPVGDRLTSLAEPAGGGKNVVNVILVDFRGWDTLGEIAVLAVAAVGVINLAAVARREMLRRGLFASAPANNGTRFGIRQSSVDGDVGPAPQWRSVILTTTTRGLVPVLAVTSVYLTFRGHNAPGGGFAGGLVLSIAVALRYFAEGPGSVRKLGIDPIKLMGAGLLLAAIVAGYPLATGGAPMESTIWKFTLPLIGQVKLVSSSFFDIGVYLVVVGSVVGAIRALVDTDETAGEANLADDLATDEVGTTR